MSWEGVKGEIAERTYRITSNHFTFSFPPSPNVLGFYCSTKCSPLMSKHSPIFLSNSPTFMLITALVWHRCDKLTPSGQEANNVHPGFSLLMSVCVAMTTHVCPISSVQAHAFACVVPVLYVLANISHKCAQRHTRSHRSSYLEIKNHSGLRKSNKWPWPKHRIGFNWLSTNIPSWESADREGLN